MSRRFVGRLVRPPLGPWLSTTSAVGWALQAAHVFGHEPLDGVMALCSGGPVSAYELGEIEKGHGFGLTAWLGMVLAMAPLVLQSEIALLWNDTLPRRRLSAIAAFAGGYGLPWLALGLGWLALTETVPFGAGGIATATGLVVVWHCAPVRRSLLNACHARPHLRAFGYAMLSDAWRFGVRSGGLCCALCGPSMMVVTLLSAHHFGATHIVAMAAMTLIAMTERYGPVRGLGWQAPWPSRQREPGWLAMTLPLPPVGKG